MTLAPRGRNTIGIMFCNTGIRSHFRAHIRTLIRVMILMYFAGTIFLRAPARGKDRCHYIMADLWLHYDSIHMPMAG
jgi:hypothetical protein